MKTSMRALLGAACAAGLLLPLLSSLARGEVTQREGVRVAVEGRIDPARLPRRGAAPVAVTIGGRISATAPGGPPRLRTIAIAINRQGRLSSRGLPLCRKGDISPSTTREALVACGRSLVGEGRFSADVRLPEQSPFPSQGKILAFNGRFHGRPAILAHVYGTRPIPTSYVLPFAIRRAHGTYGTILEASLPQVTGEWGFVTGVSMTLSRRFTYRGRSRSYLAAGCPAPAGFPGAVFPLVRTSFAFVGGPTLTSTLSRSCRVK
jgi:hypothetical protein